MTSSDPEPTAEELHKQRLKDIEAALIPDGLAIEQSIYEKAAETADL